MPNVSVLNTTSQVSGKTLAVCENTQTISGAWTFTGNQTFNGNVALGNATSDTLTVTATIVSNLLFTDATYDIGASGATRPRDLFLSRNALVGTALILGTADTSGVRLDLNGGTLEVREGDDSAYAAIKALTLEATTTATIGTTLTVTGGKISFPATQSASADANTLDDYEEGTWTPDIQFGGAAVGITYSSRAGWYVKIGKLVVFGGSFTLTSKGSSAGNASISGLPFTVENVAAQSAACYFSRTINLATIARLDGSVPINATSINLSDGATVANDTHFNNNTACEGFVGAYVTA